MSTRYYLGFSYFLGIGPVAFDRLIKQFGSAQKAYTASSDRLKEILGVKLTHKFLEFRETFDPEKELTSLEAENIQVISREHEFYPPSLKNVSDPPICLYVKGNIQFYDFSSDIFFGIVGTRKPTSYGVQVAHKFSYSLATEGFVIVSGMAMGIDSVAHEGALEAGGKTIAFLGCGVNIVYPPSNAQLYNRILQQNGLIISEFPPDMTVMPGLFVSRNRLISGLSKGIMVAEGMKDSGSLITARCAAEQGKDVFAPPGPITSEQSEAPNILLKEGAKLVTTVQDILEEFHISRSPDTGDIAQQLSAAELKVYECILAEPYPADILARKLKITIYQVLPILSGMELKGVVEKNAEGKYQLIF